MKTHILMVIILDDYQAYYVRCFKMYNKECKRIHFFKSIFTQDEFNKYLIDDYSAEFKKILNDSYLGHIVVKPLPEALIGKTVLVTYPSDGGRRSFPCLRDYKVGLFGTELNLKSLAFQEQDTVLAACATTALWSAFQQTAIIFDSKLPSPSKITTVASQSLEISNRAFPTHGLNLYQMRQAIIDVGLEPEMRKCEEMEDFSGFVMGYLKYGIPIILGIAFLNPHSQKLVDMHAVTIAGYNVGGDPTVLGSRGIPLKAHSIDKIYVHDDQIGPFSRIKLDNPISPINLTTDWDFRCNCGCNQLLLVRPRVVIVPVYHKIRITYENVSKIVNRFHEWIDSLFAKNLEWEIYLSTVNDLKKSYLHNADVDSQQRYKIMIHNYPKYIWRAVLYIDNHHALELIFDSTDIERGMFLNDIIICCDILRNNIRQAVKDTISESYLKKDYRDFVIDLLDEMSMGSEV